MKRTLFNLATLASAVSLSLATPPATAMTVQWSGNNHYYEYVSVHIHLTSAGIPT